MKFICTAHFPYKDAQSATQKYKENKELKNKMKVNEDYR